MAFVDFTDAAPDSPLPAAKTVHSPSSSGDYFSSLELRVIELARDDGLESLAPPRKRSRLGRLILGPPPPPKSLANERLEALRRLAVRVWHHGYTVPESAFHEVRAAGFSENAVGAVIDLIGRARDPFQRNPT